MPDKTAIHLCECGCGNFTSVATRTDSRAGQIKGQPVLFIQGHNRRLHLITVTSPEHRFWQKVDRQGVDDCWLWTASLDGKGYGQFWDGDQKVPSHVYSYRIHVGPVPEGKQVCHTCDVRSCVNPKHLFSGTQKDNMKDMVAKGRHRRPDVSGKKNGRYIDGRAMKKEALP